MKPSTDNSIPIEKPRKKEWQYTASRTYAWAAIPMTSGGNIHLASFEARRLYPEYEVSTRWYRTRRAAEQTARSLSPYYAIAHFQGR